MTHSVYEITSEKTPRRYIGLSKSPMTRWSQHLYHSVVDRRPLYEAMRKIGPQHFSFSVIADYDARFQAAMHEDGLIRFLTASGANPFNLTYAVTGPVAAFDPEDRLLVAVCRSVNEAGGVLAWSKANRADAVSVSKYINGMRKPPNRLFAVLGVSRSDYYAESAARFRA